MRKQIALEDKVWKELHDIRRELEHRDNTDYSLSETVLQLLNEYEELLQFKKSKEYKQYTKQIEDRKEA